MRAVSDSAAAVHIKGGSSSNGALTPAEAGKSEWNSSQGESRLQFEPGSSESDGSLCLRLSNIANIEPPDVRIIFCWQIVFHYF
jgi:hypothetical protein